MQPQILVIFQAFKQINSLPGQFGS